MTTDMGKDTKWFLRGGDFRPEKLTPENMSMLGYSDGHKALEQLAETCNLFDTETEAVKASTAVRSVLALLSHGRSERQGCNLQKKTPSCSNRHSPRTNRLPGKRLKGTHGQPFGLQSPNGQNASRHTGDSSPANAKGIHLTIQIQSFL